MDKPKLLPLEYCKLDRAAKLLGCETEDILHWGAIRAINICVKDVGGGALIGNESFLANEKDIATYVRSIYNNHKGLGKALNLSPYTKLSYDDLENDLGFDDPNNLPDSKAADCLIHGGGFWALDFFPNYYEKNHQNGNESGYLWLKYPEFKGVGDPLGLRVQVPNYWHGIPTTDDLYIIKPDLEKLYNAIHNDDGLDNIYNNAELAEKNREQENASVDISPRVTSKQSDVIKALVLLNPDLKELVDKPEKLTTKLDQLCAGKVKVTLPTGKSMGDWLGKATAEAINK